MGAPDAGPAPRSRAARPSTYRCKCHTNCRAACCRSTSPARPYQRSGAVVRERREIVVGVGRGNGHHVIRRVAGWIERRNVVVGSRCSRPQRRRWPASLAHSRSRWPGHCRKPPPPQLLLRDLRSVVNRVVERLDGIATCSRAARARNFRAMICDVPVHAGDADAVVAHGADGAGHVRAVAVVVHRVAVVVDEVVAVDVVDDSRCRRRRCRRRQSRRGCATCWRPDRDGCNRRPCRSRATMMSLLPVVMFQASGASMSASIVPPVWPVLFRRPLPGIT